jgi:hypothetical protein
MDDTNLEKNIQPNNLDAGSNSGLNKSPKKPKPFIEGITGPATETPVSPLNSKLTDAERQLIKDTTETSGASSKPTPKVINKIVIPTHKSNPFKSLLSIVAVIIILTLIGYGGYSWYTSQQLSKSSGNLNTVLPKKYQPVTAPSVASSSTTTTQTTASSSPATTLKTSQLKITTTPTGYLNVRQQPTTSSPILTKVNPGEVYTYSEFKNGWYKIVLPNNSSGWIIAQYIVKQ